MILYVIAILLPPVAVYAARGGCLSVLINIGLCLLGYVPGLVHAVWISHRYLEGREGLDEA